MVMLMPPYHGATLRADEQGVIEHFARVAEAISIPIMVQDAPLSGATLSAAFLARLGARDRRRCCYFKIEVPGAAAKLRALIDAGRRRDRRAVRRRGEHHADARSRGRRDRHDAERLPDLIRPVVEYFLAGREEGSGAVDALHPPLVNYENRQCGLRATKTATKEGGVIKSDAVRHPLEPMHPQTRAGLLALAAELGAARAAVGQEQLTASALLGAARELLARSRKLEFLAPGRARLRPARSTRGRRRGARDALRRDRQARRAARHEPGPVRDDADRRAVRRGRRRPRLDGHRAPVDKPSASIRGGLIEGSTGSAPRRAAAAGLAAERFGAAERFHRLVRAESLPAVFLEASGRQFHAVELPAALEVDEASDRHLAAARTGSHPSGDRHRWVRGETDRAVPRAISSTARGAADRCRAGRSP